MYHVCFQGKKLPPLGQTPSQETHEREELPDTLAVVPDYEMTGYLSDSSEVGLNFH